MRFVAAVVLVGAFVLVAVLTRYEYQSQFTPPRRIDRWTGRIERWECPKSPPTAGRACESPYRWEEWR